MAMPLGISNAKAWLLGLELSHQRDTSLLLLSPEGDTSLPVCVSHRWWATTQLFFYPLCRPLG
jgi:hypothetical protein